MSFFYLMNSKNQKVKDIEKAMWLVAGTDQAADQLPIGESDRDMASAAIRTVGDGVFHAIYKHEDTKVDAHFYSEDYKPRPLAAAGIEYVENAGLVKVNGDWRQVNIINGEREYAALRPTVEFPEGAQLRLRKHRLFNILLEGFSFKIYIAHLREYIKDQQFLEQWALVLEGKNKEALDIRMKNIRHARAGRRVRAALREDDDSNGNWAKVEAQMGDNGDMSDGDTEPDQEDAEEVVAIGSKTLLIDDYNNRGKKVNMFDLPADNYDLRLAKTVYPWWWDGKNPTSVSQWKTFADKAWKIDLPRVEAS